MGVKKSLIRLSSNPFTYVSHRQDKWDECILFFEFAHNNSVNPSTGHSPSSSRMFNHHVHPDSFWILCYLTMCHWLLFLIPPNFRVLNWPPLWSWTSLTMCGRPSVSCTAFQMNFEFETPTCRNLKLTKSGMQYCSRQKMFN